MFSDVQKYVTLCRDTAGQERFRTITTAYYRGAMVSSLSLSLGPKCSGHLRSEYLDSEVPQPHPSGKSVVHTVHYCAIIFNPSFNSSLTGCLCGFNYGT